MPGTETAIRTSFACTPPILLALMCETMIAAGSIPSAVAPSGHRFSPRERRAIAQFDPWLLHGAWLTAVSCLTRRIRLALLIGGDTRSAGDQGNSRDAGQKRRQRHPRL